MKHLWQLIQARKKTAIVIAILFVLGGGWFVYAQNGATTETRYVLAQVERGTLVTSVSASGQVQGEAEVEVRPEASAAITQIVAKNGQHVEEGDVIAILDAKDAQTSVRDASLSLASAELSLQKLTASPNAVSLLQAEHALAEAKRTLEDLEDDPTEEEMQNATNIVSSLERALVQAERSLEEMQITSVQDLASASEDGYRSVGEAFTDLSDVMTDLKGFFGTDTNEQEYVGNYALFVGTDEVEDLFRAYSVAKRSYDAAWLSYRGTSYESDTTTKLATISSTLTAAHQIGDVLADAKTLLNTIDAQGYDRSAIRDVIEEMLITIPQDMTTVNGHVASLQTSRDKLQTSIISIPHDVKNAEDSVVSAKENLAEAKASLEDLLDGPDTDELAKAKEQVQEKQASLDDLHAGTDALDLRSQQITVQDRRNALLDAQETLAKYTVRAPISGTVAKLSLVRGEMASSGSALATIVADQLTAEVSLNEVDVAKVTLGQSVTLAFDAVEDLTISGKVKDVDVIGAVSQGVVSYAVRISFDTQDVRILSGMSVNATILTHVEQNVLLVPSSAIKESGQGMIVQVLQTSEVNATSTQGVASDIPPTEVSVVVGSSNDTDTVIVSGVEEGMYVVTRTTTGTASGSTTSSTTSTPSLFGGGAGGATMRPR